MPHDVSYSQKNDKNLIELVKKVIHQSPEHFLSYVSPILRNNDLHHLQIRDRVPSDESEKHIFKPDCIFCERAGCRKVKHGGTWTTEPTCKIEFGGGDTILKVAEEKKYFDLLYRIKGFDLLACDLGTTEAAGRTTPEIHQHGRALTLQQPYTRPKLNKHIINAFPVFVPSLTPTISKR